MRVDDRLLDQLATERGLFHRDDEDERLPRGITRAPLDALRERLRPGMRTLETGCGGTTVVFLAAGARHTTVTPDAREAERVREYCERLGISTEGFDVRVGSSDSVLPGWGEELDLVLVDGAHRMPFPLIDWHYTAPSLRVGGHLFLDDVAIPSVHVLFDFLRRDEHWRLIGVPGDKTAIFEKLANPPDDPTADWELQVYNYPWVYGHIPLARRWHHTRERAFRTPWLRRVLRRPPLWRRPG